MLKNLTIMCALFLISIILEKILKIDIKKSGVKATNLASGIIGSQTEKWHKKNTQNKELSHKQKGFPNSRLYLLIDGIIFDLGFTNVTVEGFIITILIATTSLTAYIYSLTHSTILCVILWLCLNILLTTLLFMKSATSHFKRERERMDAEDIIYGSLGKGVVMAIKENIPLFGDSVRPFFEDFDDDINKYQLTVPQALDNLNKKLGPNFTQYRNQLENYDLIGDEDMIESFQDFTKENARVRINLIKLEKRLHDCNMAYIIELLVISVMALAMFSNHEGGILGAFSDKGIQIALGLHIILITAGFAFLQAQRTIRRSK